MTEFTPGAIRRPTTRGTEVSDPHQFRRPGGQIRTSPAADTTGTRPVEAAGKPRNSAIPKESGAPDIGR